MYLILASFVFAAVYIGVRRVLVDVYSTFVCACITLLVSPAVLLGTAMLVELFTGKASGFGVAIGLAFIGVLLPLVALLGLFAGALVGWIRLGVAAVSGSKVKEADDQLCHFCEHPLVEHAVSAMRPACVICNHAGCGCTVPLPASNERTSS